LVPDPRDPDPAFEPPHRQAPRMTVLRSASGSRIDCDDCTHHVAASRLSIEDVRRATGYVNHDGRDLCPSCWYEHTSSRLNTSRAPPSDDAPAAA
jgi:hypothetical protein